MNAAQSAMGTVVLRDVEKRFDQTLACSQINLTIGQGEFFTFLGPSGCGKTTILRLIAGFITPDKGTIHLADRDITHVPPEKRHVGMVFQNYALFPHLNVRQNIAYGLAIQKKTADEIRAAVTRSMEMIGLTGYGDRRISELSGGQQQRVALARSLAVEPRVLLLDEPLSNLDARLRDRLRQEIKFLQKKLAITTIFVTHDQTEALTLSDRIAVCDSGRIAQVGTPQDIYNSPESAFVAGFIGDANLFKADFSRGKARIAQGLELHMENGSTNLPGNARYVSIRPQDIALSAADMGTSNTFRGYLEEIQLNGIWIDYMVRVQDTLLRVAALNTTMRQHDLLRGKDVFVSIPAPCIKVLSR